MMKTYLKTAIKKVVVAGLAVAACSTLKAETFYVSPGVIPLLSAKQQIIKRV